MSDLYRKRRISLVVLLIIFFVVIIGANTPINQSTSKPEVKSYTTDLSDKNLAINGLKSLAIKEADLSEEYIRDKFGSGWRTTGGCDTRNIILNRDLLNPIVNEKCEVLSGTLNDPYTGKVIDFKRGSGTSDDVQIDHVVPLSDAWKKGARLLSEERRVELANDPLELLAVDGVTNQKKSDGDASVWLPSNKAFRCQYVSRQIAVKIKYGLWVTDTEFNSIASVLSTCAGQLLPNP